MKKGVLLWCVLFGFMVNAGHMRAATFNITANNTTALKSAIRQANINNEADVINLTTSTYTLTAPDNMLNGINGLPVIVDDVSGLDLTINGNNADLYRSSENGTPDFRLMQIASNATVKISDFNFLNGKTADTNENGNNDDNGGAICVHDGSLTAINCDFLFNSAPQDAGGAVSVCVPHFKATFTAQNCYFGDNYAFSGSAIHNNGFVGNATTTLTSCVFTGNTSENGGAISNNAAFGNTILNITDCTITDNQALQGGAIENRVSQGKTSVVVKRSLLESNQAVFGGGAIYSYADRGESSFLLSNCTLADNQSEGTIYSQGGAIYCGNDSQSQSTFSLENCTLSKNAASAGGDSIYNDGSASSNSVVQMANSIFKPGHASGNFINKAGLFTSLGYNLSSDAASGLLKGPGDSIGIDPLLDLDGPRSMGGTAAIALLPNSPALNAGDSNFTGPPNTDQRGAGFARVRGGRVDIGAFEAQMPTLSVIDAPPAPEGSAAAPNAATATIQLSPKWDEEVTVDYHTVDNTALSGSDYVGTNGTLIFAPGETTKIAKVDFIGDAVPEITERLFLVLSSVRGAVIGRNQGNAYIANDDGPSVSINDVTVSESDTDTTATFTVKLSAPSNQKISVNAITANGTATSPADYTGGGQTLIFMPGEVSKTFAVTVRGDILDEASEAFYVLLSSPANASVGRGRGVATITDNDAPPAISIENISLSEGNSGTRAAVFRLHLSAPSGVPVKVTASTQDSGLHPATVNDDYVSLAPTSFTFTTGQTDLLVRVNIKGDLTREVNETFALKLTSPINATIAKSSAVCTILNDDEQLYISDAQISDPENSSATLVFSVNLTTPCRQTVTASYTTRDNTALAGSDYIAQSGTLTFAPGQTRQLITITITGDALYEDYENFFVVLSNIRNAAPGKTMGVGNIFPSGPPPPPFVVFNQSADAVK